MKKVIISFIGTDGAGKSTLIAEVQKRLEQQLKGKVKTVYFGWKPFLPTTKLLSFILRKKNYQIADKMNSKNNNSFSEENKLHLFQEIMLSYYYLEYLSRYIFQLRISSFKSIMLVDRYFYDLYAHYEYAKQSYVFPILLKMMPKPDLIFLLDVDVQTAKKRKPEMDLELLQKHHLHYQQLSSLINAKVVKTDLSLEQSLQQVLELSAEIINKK